MDAKDIAEELQETNVVDESDGQRAPDDSTPEKMLTASQVNVLVQKAKRKGEQKMQEQLDAARQELEQLKSQQSQPQAAQEPQQSSPQGVDQAALQQLVAQQIAKQQEESQRKQHEQQLQDEVNQVAQQYFGKMASGKDMFEDFEAITADFNPAEFPQLVFLANQVDNTPAVIYELSKNPGKLADLAVLVEKSPSMARAQIAKLSQSIKTNDEAKRGLQEAQDPLDRLKPSPVGTDGKKPGLRDYKQAAYLRG